MSWKTTRKFRGDTYKTRLWATEEQWERRLQTIRDSGATIVSEGVFPFDPYAVGEPGMKRYWALVKQKEG